MWFDDDPEVFINGEVASWIASAALHRAADLIAPEEDE